MSEFRLTIDTGDGSQYGLASELPDLLSKVSSQVRHGESAGAILDLNGNTVGSFSHDITENDFKAQLDEIVRQAIEMLDAKTQLVYVDYRDKLMDDQVAKLGTWDGVMEVEDQITDVFWEQEVASVEEYAERAVKEAGFEASDFELLKDDDGIAWERLRDAIRERDESNVLKELADNSDPVLLRITCIGEDDGWSFVDVTAADVLTKLGVPTPQWTEHNVEAIDYALANHSPEYSVTLGFWIVSIRPSAMYELLLADAKYVDITGPHLYLGNPFVGSGFITEKPLQLTVRVAREDLVTDKAAFGYAVAEVYGGLYASEYEADIVAVPKVSLDKA